MLQLVPGVPLSFDQSNFEFAAPRIADSSYEHLPCVYIQHCVAYGQMASHGSDKCRSNRNNTEASRWQKTATATAAAAAAAAAEENLVSVTRC